MLIFPFILICWIYPCDEIPPENEIILAVVKDRACFAILYPEEAQRIMAEIYGEHPSTTLHVNYPFLPPKSYDPIHLEKWSRLSNDDQCECFKMNSD
jgi:hypothetical protein